MDNTTRRSTKVFERLSLAQVRQHSPFCKATHCFGFCFSVFPQGPAYRFLNEKLVGRCTRLDQGKQQLLIGLGLIRQLEQDRCSRKPDVVSLHPRCHIRPDQLGIEGKQLACGMSRQIVDRVLPRLCSNPVDDPRQMLRCQLLFSLLQQVHRHVLILALSQQRERQK